MRGAFQVAVCIGALGVPCIAAQSIASSRPVVHAAVRRGPIRVDGVLDEPAWADAGVISDLVQQAPRPGEPTPYRTEVRILVDSEAIYVGVTCDGSRAGAHRRPHAPARRRHDRRRHVALVFDTFNDRRAYAFRVNAAGARTDGLISGPGETSNDWDGVWDAKVLRTPDGLDGRDPHPRRDPEVHAASRRLGLQRRDGPSRATA